VAAASCEAGCAHFVAPGIGRRDLEAARTLADQIRKREKLKRRELQLYKEEWAARMQGGPGRQLVVQEVASLALESCICIRTLQFVGLGLCVAVRKQAPCHTGLTSHL
jgi:hypothetical protein